jgi:hypothetical protein
MEIELQIALIGILGTLGGTVLGWFLNTLSQKGKMNIYISSWNDEFTYNNKGCMAPSSSIEQTQYYGYKLSMDLYNSSGEIKIMRNIKILFTNGKSILFQSIPKDDQTKRISSPMTYYDDISPVNIPAKSVININLHNGVWEKNDSLEFIWNVKSVYLVYTDEKNKNKKIMISKENYENHFANHHIEE